MENWILVTSEDHFFINKNPFREQLIQNNNKNWSRTKYFNKNTDTFTTAPPKDKIYLIWPKVNSFHFEEPNDHVNPMENTHDDTLLIDTQ